MARYDPSKFHKKCPTCKDYKSIEDSITIAGRKIYIKSPCPQCCEYRYRIHIRRIMRKYRNQR